MSIEKVIVRKPFNGQVVSYITSNGVVAYSDNLQFEEYKTNKSLEGVDVELITMDEYMIRHEEYYSTPFTKISEEDYYSSLEALPPVKWHWINPELNVFFMSEAYSGTMHDCLMFHKPTGTHWAGRKDILSSDEKLLQMFNQEALGINRN